MSNPRLSPAVIVSLSESACLAYHIERNEIHRLSPTAALLLELCDGTQSREAIFDTLTPVMDATGIASCEEWLDQAKSNQLISEDAATRRPALTATELSTLAATLRNQDRVLAAFICQQRAAELAGDDPDQWYALGELAHIIGHRETARAAYEKYQQAHPDDVEIGHLLTALRDEPPPSRASNAYIENLYSHFATFYDENLCDDLDYRAPQWLLQAISDPLKGHHDLQVLDLGCGTGLFGKTIRPIARRLTGIDLSSAMVERCKNSGVYDRLETAEITAWLSRESADRYDLITICDTLIYFGDLRQVIPQAMGLLSDGGILGFTVEAGETYPHRLSDSGRFTHHRDHLTEVARECDATILSLTSQILRYEYGQPVTGWVAVLRREI